MSDKTPSVKNDNECQPPVSGDDYIEGLQRSYTERVDRSRFFHEIYGEFLARIPPRDGVDDE